MRYELADAAIESRSLSLQQIDCSCGFLNAACDPKLMTIQFGYSLPILTLMANSQLPLPHFWLMNRGEVERIEPGELSV